MHIDQIVVGASPGDAVTESALRIRDALRLAVDSDLYAFHIDQRLHGHIGRMQDYPLPEHRSSSDVIIYHLSIGDPRVLDFVRHRGERLFVVYHNITPSSFFRKLDPPFADFLDQGRRLLPLVLEKADAVFADSAFNAEELEALGCPNVVVCPPPLHLRRLLETVPDPDIVEQLPVAVPAKMALFVGQMLPHKRPDFLVGAHHLLVANALPDARLVLAGAARNPRYAHGLRSLIAETNLDTVWLTGELDDAQLAAFFRRADVFVTASEHEGFCVPIVEAFHFGVPVVARGFGAVPDTAGDAAIVLPPDASARDFAEATRRVLLDHDLHHELAERGRRRAAQFDADQLTGRMLSAIRAALEQPSAFA